MQTKVKAHWKGVVFLVLLGYMVMGPVVRQIWKPKSKMAMLLPAWVMYTGYGSEVCELAVERGNLIPRSETGEDQEDVEWELMRRSEVTQLTGVTKLSSTTTAHRAALTMLCELTRGRNGRAYIRARSRCGAVLPAGWKYWSDFSDGNLCVDEGGSFSEARWNTTSAMYKISAKETRQVDLIAMAIAFWSSVLLLLIYFMKLLWDKGIIFTLTGYWSKFIHWIESYRGPTRVCAIMRLCFVAVLWTRFAYEFHPAISSKDLPYKYKEMWGCAFYLTSFLMGLGFYSRLSSFACGMSLLSMAWYEMITRNMDRGGHIHLLVIGPVLLSFTPCGDYYSLDCVLSRFYSSPSRNSGRKRNYNFLKQKEKRQKKRANGELWALPLLATQMMVVYYWAAWTKTNSGFLNGDRTEQLWAYTYNGMDWAQIPYFHEMNLLSSIGTVALEYLLAFYYLFPSAFQKTFIILGILFHLAIYVTIPVYTFSVTCFIYYLSWLNPHEFELYFSYFAGEAPAHHKPSKAGKGTEIV